MSEQRTYEKRDLLEMERKNNSFVGIDSDGCVFDSMEIKQKQCFHGVIVSHWKLEKIEKYVRETAEFVNLYSSWRGQNRFTALLKVFELLRRRKEVISAGATIPSFVDLQAFADSGTALGNPSLAREAEATGSEELASVLEWSEAVNRKVTEVVTDVPPFKWVQESLQKMREHSDVICVSQTPVEALLREWRQHDIEQYVSAIAGQELGTKIEHVEMAAAGRYRPDRMLIIGDALGDYRTAKATHALFYPINPAGEEASWERFYKEAYDRFLEGDYAGEYESDLFREFKTLLPDDPPWE